MTRDEHAASDRDAAPTVGYSFEYGPRGRRINEHYVTPAIADGSLGPWHRTTLRLQLLGGHLQASNSLVTSALGKQLRMMALGNWDEADVRMKPAADVDFDAVRERGGRVERGLLGAWYTVEYPDEG